MTSGSRSGSGWLSRMWDSLERDEKKMVVHFGLGIVTIYISIKAQQYLMSSLVNPKYAKQKAQALGILQAVGYSKKAASRVLQQLNQHEIVVMQDLVTNQDDMNNLSDIAGLQKAKDILNRNLRVAQKMKKEKKLAQLVNITPGILLYGPPGCGKTMMARAVSKEMGFRFLVVKPSVVNNKWVGESEKTIQAIFSLAGKLSPMVIFIDEIEVLLGSRGSFSQSDFKDTKIAEFLTAWDGFHKTGSSTIVIGATNRKEILDEAILRRLPIKIEIPMPDKNSRKQIFDKKLIQEGVELDVDIERYVNQTSDWNASKITNFLESVLTIAVQEAFEDSAQDEEDSDSEIFQDANSDFEDEEKSSKPFITKFFSFFGSFRKQKEKNTKPDDQIQSIIKIREKHFDSAFELFVETKTGFPLANTALVVPSVS